MCLSCPVFFECREFQKRTKSEYGLWAGEIVKRGKK
jgi:hypothetical protein